MKQSKNLLSVFVVLIKGVEILIPVALGLFRLPIFRISMGLIIN
jgi:hypothetical protein